MDDPDSHDESERDESPERGSEERSTNTGVVHLGINVGIGSLSDLLGGGLGERRASGSERGRWQRIDASGRKGRDQSSRSSMDETDELVDVADEFLVDTHRTEEEFVVTAELPGVDESELDVGIDVSSNDLVIGVDGRSIERVELPWSSTDAAKVWFNNGILEARFKPGEEGESDADEET